jgi:hypothetical protein
MFKCSNKGCAIVPLGGIEYNLAFKHEQTCPFNAYQCPLGCGELFQGVHAIQHLENHYLNKVVICQKCELSIPVKKFKEHDCFAALMEQMSLEETSLRSTIRRH